mgnify:CR=1 FL=1
MNHNIKPGVATGDQVQEIFKLAKEKQFALPAVNVIGSSSINGVLETAKKLNAPVIIQFSNGGAGFNAGKGLSNEDQKAAISGSIAGAHHVHTMAKAYGVPVILHTDHCAKNLLPWIDGLMDANEKFYKDNSDIYKFSWFLCVISGFFAVTILMLMYWFDTTNEASYDSRYWIFVQLTDWLDIPYEGPHGFRYWIFTACIFFLFILPTFRGAKELTPQAIEWLEYKAKERKKQEEADRKAKEAKLLAEKDREAKIEAERLALEEAKQAEIKRKRKEEEAKKRAEQEKLQREIDAKKAQTKEMLESLKVEPLNKINKLTKKKEDLALVIDKEKNIINELSKKYSFLKKIVPDRFD